MGPEGKENFFIAHATEYCKNLLGPAPGNMISLNNHFGRQMRW